MPDSARRRKCLLRRREKAGKRDNSGEKANQVQTKVTPCPVHTQYGHRLYSLKGGEKIYHDWRMMLTITQTIKKKR